MFGALTMIAVACHQSPPTDGGAAIKSQQGALAPVAAATALPADGKVPPRRDYAAIVQAPDRSPEDRALDPGRHPEQFLVFLDLPVNAHVAELGAGGGYTTELLARLLCPEGQIFAQNPRWVLERFAERPLSERLKKPVMNCVARIDREFDDPLSPDVGPLDAVISPFFYHDTVWTKVDRDRMNHSVFAALRPGGAYFVLDSSALPGSGESAAETLHRIDEDLVRKEVIRAGFTFESASGFLRNPDDDRTWNSSPRQAGTRRGTSDRFALKFVKPQVPTATTPAVGSSALTAGSATRTLAVALPERAGAFIAGPLAVEPQFIRRSYTRGETRISVTIAAPEATPLRYEDWIQMSAASPQVQLEIAPNAGAGFCDCASDSAQATCNVHIHLRSGHHVEMMGEQNAFRGEFDALLSRLPLRLLGT